MSLQFCLARSSSTPLLPCGARFTDTGWKSSPPGRLRSKILALETMFLCTMEANIHRDSNGSSKSNLQFYIQNELMGKQNPFLTAYVKNSQGSTTTPASSCMLPVETMLNISRFFFPEYSTTTVPFTVQYSIDATVLR